MDFSVILVLLERFSTERSLQLLEMTCSQSSWLISIPFTHRFEIMWLFVDKASHRLFLFNFVQKDKSSVFNSGLSSSKLSIRVYDRCITFKLFPNNFGDCSPRHLWRSKVFRFAKQVQKLKISLSTRVWHSLKVSSVILEQFETSGFRLFVVIFQSEKLSEERLGKFFQSTYRLKETIFS